MYVYSLSLSISLSLSLSLSRTHTRTHSQTHTLFKPFSLPEPKAQFYFSDRNLLIVFFVFDVAILIVLVQFSQFCLLQKHCVIFHQTWNKASLDEEDSNWIKWWSTPFSKDDNSKIPKKKTLTKFQIFNLTWHKASSQEPLGF